MAIPNPTTNFDEAIVGYSNAARARFGPALSTVPKPPITDKTAEAELMAAFTQLSSAAHMQSEQRNRVGFEAVVDLMQTTADAAEKISTKLVALLHAAVPGDTQQPVPDDYALIYELKATLEVLARLSPSSVWAAPNGAASNNQ